MGFSLAKFTNWLFGAKAKPAEAPADSITSFPEFTTGFREPESIKFLQLAPHHQWERHGKIKKKHKHCQDHEDYDMVIVQSNGECLSGSESDDSDWSVGWLEPHSEEFVEAGEDDFEISFAVLVRCYGRGKSIQPKSPKNRFKPAAKRQGNQFMDGKNYIEQWFPSL